jgi:alkanesulfonate monooxygenase SsuD/methylene tetrahydromethanopterin reductase-like flavin-dependent oxidoreductase (luciferase family)
MMRFGVHLPLIQFGEEPLGLAALTGYVGDAAALGYEYLCANDHLYFARPWLDGPTALAATLEAGAGMTPATTVALPVIRGPAQTARLLSALDQLSGGRLICGVGPGSSARDYAAVGIPFEERWQRFEQALGELRSMLSGQPLWVASWGSPAGLARVARHGDGCLASAYNTTPDVFAAALDRLPDGFPNALATMWLYVTDSRREAERQLAGTLAPLLGRSVEALSAQGLLIGSPEACAERVQAYAAAGVERLFIWPLGDERSQLERFRTDVLDNLPT